MTKPLPFTENSLRRAISAARKAGLRIHGIKADGTLLVGDGQISDPPAGEVSSDEVSSDNGHGSDAPQLSVWEDVEA